MRLTAKENDRRARMEVEANRFASLILIPPPMLRRAVGEQSPDLQHIVKLAADFKVSKEAMARAYAERHHEVLAVVVVHNGKVLRSYRHRMRFPFIQPAAGAQVPRGSLYHRGKHEQGVASDFAEGIADDWIDVKRGERAPALYEQVYLQQKGFALILLHLVEPDEDDEDERALEQSWEPRFRR
jgi:hypothetical protein